MWLQLFAAIASFQVIYVLNYGYVRLNHGYQGRDNRTSSPSFSCGEVKKISYPFKLQGTKCPGFPLICQDHTTLLLNLTQYYNRDDSLGKKYQRPQFRGTFHVQKIDLDSDSPRSSVIQIADPNFASNDSVSSVCLKPRYSIRGDTRKSMQQSTGNGFGPFDDITKPAGLIDEEIVAWVRCRKAQLDPATYLPLPCLNSSSSDFSEMWRSYLLLKAMSIAELDRSCQIVATTPISYDKGDLEVLNLTGISRRLRMGFRLTAGSLCDFCDYKIDGGCLLPFCIPESSPIDIWRMARKQLVWIAKFFVVVFGVVPRISGILFLAGLLIYKLKNKYSPSNDVEKLLQKCQNLMPRRYSYPEIKIITGHFREKLGQGGFGSVFKGSLFDGRPVAVKLLGKAKGGGQDFINEVATIGRIHHVNIVRLLGFCSEGGTRALVYEFMPNGSLDKYIFPGNGRSHLLNWEMLFKIALGIARGIEYLHRGCDVCILHFDIKPHNVLLDENLCPKISDFGLAKRSPTQNTMTLSGYRGTIGYIAPEQVSRNFGGVSCKSDVYSFGMLLLKMAERTRKGDELASGSTSIYFPAWIYDRLSEGREAEIGEATEIEMEVVKKLALVGLCCIQMMPANRPSMSQVIEMLEGISDALQLPPKASFMFPDGTYNDDCSVLSICQGEAEEVTSLLGKKGSASSTSGGDWCGSPLA